MNNKNMNFLLLLVAMLATQSWAYSPMSISTRRSMIQSTFTASVSTLILSPSLAIAEDAQSNMNQEEGQELTKVNETEFRRERRVWSLRREHTWLKRRIEREKIAKSRQLAKQGLAEEFMLSEQSRRNKQ